MTTTSIELSRKLDTAGFWEGQEPIEKHAFGFGLLIPAATLDDLTTALGLDKPWLCDNHDVYECKICAAVCAVVHAIMEHGLTPDALARVWLELNGGEE